MESSPIEKQLHAELVAEVDKLRSELLPKMTKLSTIEGGVEANEYICFALAAVSKSAEALLQDLKVAISSVRFCVTGTEAERLTKLDLFAEIVANIVNLSLVPIKVMARVPTKAIEKYGHKLSEQLFKRISELATTGIPVTDAITAAVNASAISDSDKAAVCKEFLDSFNEAKAWGDSSTTVSGLDLFDKQARSTTDDTTMVTDAILPNSFQIIWRDEYTANTPDSASIFDDAMLQVVDSDPFNKSTAINMLASAIFNSATVSHVELTKCVNNLARSIFLETKGFATLVIMDVTKDDTGKPRAGFCVVDVEPYMQNDKSKLALSKLLRSLVKRYGSNSTMMISESWLVKRQADTPLEDLQRPSESPHRIEALIVTAAFKTGKAVYIVNNIVRKDDTVSLGEPDVIESNLPRESDGCFGSFSQ